MVTPPPIPADGRILYFARDRVDFGFLSHFHPAEIDLDGERWPTAEHYYQAQKSDHPEYRAAIRAVDAPQMAKRLAAAPSSPRRISRDSWFKASNASPRSDWAEIKREVMRRADHAKFSQHRDLAALLDATGEAVLIEDAPFDKFWGQDANGDGQNWAGRILMDLRAQLRVR